MNNHSEDHLKNLQYKILSRKDIIDHGFIKLEQVELELDTFRGGKEVVTRYGLVRPEVVAIILYRVDINALVLIEQFRYSTLRTGNGWVKEIIAGVVEPGEDIKKAAYRECLEESGYTPEELKEVFTFYPSVGLSNQLIHLYYAEVTEEHKTHKGGGVEAEGEDVRVWEIPINEVKEQIIRGELTDAKALVGLQWFFLSKGK